ncbi:radical SAM protein [Vallitalea okinawensis]|uniref:radical SAM protein n=1 Tax=Vallitalea okinawensis TaxID=2078660 RepID=UPI00130045DC|nr:radical SAM protein [Vallitalea okinawensis]
MERYVVHVTKKCNLDCKYCYETDKSSLYTWDEVKEVIDNIAKFNKDRIFEIEFLGGEPLLAFDIIKSAVEYIEKLKNVEVHRYMITTNGTILNPDIDEFLYAYPTVHIGISLDGNKSMNQLRVFKDTQLNSYDTVIENINILLASGYKDRLSVHIVTHPYNIGYLSKGIKHLYNKGVRIIGIGTVENTLPLTDEYMEVFKREFKEISTDILNDKYPDLRIDLLEYLKPKSDQRHYIKDETGKTIAESYGRTKDDITSQDIYNSYVGKSPLGEIIYDLREFVYLQNQEIQNVG